MEAEITTKKVVSPLINKIITVKPIPKREGILYEQTGRTSLPGAKDGLRGVPIDPVTNRFPEPLTPDERAWFESKEAGLGFEPGDLLANHPNKKITYWTKYSIVLNSNEMLNLHLSNPGEYLRYAFLRAQAEVIAPSWDERKEKNYTHAFVDMEKTNSQKATNSDNTAECYMYLGSINHSVPKMKAFLATYYRVSKSRKKMPLQANSEWLRGELSEIIKDDLKGFLAVKSDPLILTKLFVEECIAEGVIVKDAKNLYKIPGYEEIYTITELAEELSGKTPASQKLYGKLQAQLDGKKQ